MFERFTDRARRVVVLAQEEAKMLNHNYIPGVRSPNGGVLFAHRLFSERCGPRDSEQHTSRNKYRLARARPWRMLGDS